VGAKLDISGKRFKTLIAIRPDGKSKFGGTLWLCRCINCALEVTHQLGNLQNGSIRCECQYLPKGEQAFRELFRDYVHGAKKRGLEFKLDRDSIFRILVIDRCVYCGVEPRQVTTRKGDKFTYNGIDRVDNTKGYVPKNVVTCCTTCNKAKHTMSREEFLRWVKRVYNHSVRSYF
jgi:hypothetical protein